MRSAAFLSSLGLALGCAITTLAHADVNAHAPPLPDVQLRMPGHGTYNGPIIDGVGEGRFSTGDSYTGEWKNGKPDGIGKMTYMLGGSYEGEWKNGLRDGRGIMTFAGSGRRAEVRFVDGRRVDVVIEQPSAATLAARFSLLATEDPAGSHIRNKVAYGPLPLDRGYDELTADQKRLVRSYYPALDAGDEPPYPARGGQELYPFLVSLARTAQPQDDILVYVALDANAQVTSVTTVSHFEERMKRMVANAAALIKYKPAQCGGQPCPGVVAFNMSLRVKL
jgi:hypothetical protein